MIRQKYINALCCFLIVLAVGITGLVMAGASTGIIAQNTTMGYEDRLFDASRVHTINIVMDDWDTWVETCSDEEYTDCSVIIDNEAYKNVAIRAKGNTSLSNVASYGNNRYSFKIEFDHYDSNKSYYGLDKLSLNNIIQDNTYMKDFLTYQMMDAFGVSAPLCSYVQILVNGEEWGLYLAVEGVEDAFLERNFSGTGDLYKPDSMSMGGGRGQGKEFDMDSWKEDNQNTDNQETDQTEPSQSDTSSFALPETDSNAQSQDQSETQETDMQAGFTPPSGQNPAGQMEAFDPSAQNGQFPFQPQMTQGMEGQAPASPDQGQMEFNEPAAQEENSDTDQQDADLQDQNIDQNQFQQPQAGMPGGDGMDRGEFGNGQSMGSDDVSLIYSDDDVSSYSNIFDNAKTDISEADETRLIAALKKLNQNEDIEEVVNVEEVIRYFVVHNFVCNFDSYTGSMIHNYYLYENDGQLSMIPWDYNLAFGGFESMSDATSLINYPIDSPVSGGDIDSRPMLAWIFNNEEYTDLYHTYFQEFLDTFFENGQLETLIQTTTDLIAPYVESDPTKFCTTEEFETGAATLKEFAALRAQSIEKQLDGTIGSTTDTQDAATFVDGSSLTVSDMGSMNNGQGMSGPGGQMQPGNQPGQGLDAEGENPSGTMQAAPDSGQSPEGENTGAPNSNSQVQGADSDQQPMQPGNQPRQEMPAAGENPSGTMSPASDSGQQPEGDSADATDSNSMPQSADVSQQPMQQENQSQQGMHGAEGMPDFGNADQPDLNTFPAGQDALAGNQMQMPENSSTISASVWILLAASGIVLIIGLAIAVLYKRV